MTTTAAQTLKEVLDRADPNELADALRQLGLGSMFEMVEEDTGTITAAAAITLAYPAAWVQSARVVTASAGTTVGTYIVGDHSVTKIVPPGGASAAVGIAALGTDNQTITFPANVTRVIVKYAPIKKAVTEDFAQS